MATKEAIVGIPADNRSHRHDLPPPSFCMGQGEEGSGAHFLSPHPTFSKDQVLCFPSMGRSLNPERDLKVQELSPSGYHLRFDEGSSL